MTRSRRGATDLSGILVVDKPLGMTSHDVVSAVRASTGEGRVGHAGTLDPGASGVLVVLVGPATRLAPFLSAATKSYEARIAFGVQTDTDDADGVPVLIASVPDVLADRSFAREQVAALIGERLQRPPAYSAVKRHGIASHRAARAGRVLALDQRPIRVLDARLEGLSTAPGVAWDLTLTVSKGTYVRSLARDLGISLGCAAHLSALRRVSSGPLTLRDAHSLDDVTTSGPDITPRFADPVRALGIPVVEPSPEITRLALDGRAIDRALCPDAPADGTVALADAGRLYAVYRASAERLHPWVVLPGGASR
ncbi:MAG TPA: tRNA pseudouridine(55) synthase TruB [Coriobacteriia bacterium]|nr:tRNA pseudouridine(55) synthase TruB [Coriobacteriia bacterium]